MFPFRNSKSNLLILKIAREQESLEGISHTGRILNAKSEIHVSQLLLSSKYFWLSSFQDYDKIMLLHPFWHEAKPMFCFAFLANKMRTKMKGHSPSEASRPLCTWPGTLSPGEVVGHTGQNGACCQPQSSTMRNASYWPILGKQSEWGINPCHRSQSCLFQQLTLPHTLDDVGIWSWRKGPMKRLEFLLGNF